MGSVPSERLSLMEGSEVEFSYKQNGFKNVWYRAIIESNPKSKLRQLCVRLLKDESSTLLTHLINKVKFRPVPPEYVQAGIDIKIGSIVDADYKCGWWTGLVVKQIEVDKCLVFFDSSLQILQFERKLLRPHLDWFDDNQWVIPGPDVQLMDHEAAAMRTLVNIRAPGSVTAFLMHWSETLQEAFLVSHILKLPKALVLTQWVVRLTEQNNWFRRYVYTTRAGSR
ncbi:hypothetical protein Bca52824_001541 [Brassica carinata]|uniref:Agenet domain-containing protein n=1 Tax=Brassica carinata TaxID=52824 RepID=A0A8X7WHL4_BRACI|nr:hypothetical protein Bca52824_001541 [Brassica carinata]